MGICLIPYQLLVVISFGTPTFLVYMNDLPSVSKVLLFYLFANDTSIYYEAKDLISLQKILNRELKKSEKVARN